MDYSSYAESTASTGASMLTLVFELAIAVLAVVAMWVLFQKAGREGWKSIIPFYNAWVEFDIVYGAGWKMFLLLVPLLNIALSIMFRYRIAQVYGRSTAFAICNIFFSPITDLIMAFDGKSNYQGPCSSFM